MIHVQVNEFNDNDGTVGTVRKSVNVMIRWGGWIRQKSSLPLAVDELLAMDGQRVDIELNPSIRLFLSLWNQTKSAYAATRGPLGSFPKINWWGIFTVAAAAAFSNTANLLAELDAACSSAAGTRSGEKKYLKGRLHPASGAWHVGYGLYGPVRCDDSDSLSPSTIVRVVCVRCTVVAMVRHGDGDGSSSRSKEWMQSWNIGIGLTYLWLMTYDDWLLIHYDVY